MKFKKKDVVNVDGFLIERVTNEDVKTFRDAAKIIRAIKNDTLQLGVATDNIEGMANGDTLRILRSLLKGGLIESNKKVVVAGEISSGIAIFALNNFSEGILNLDRGSDVDIKRNIETVEMLCKALDSYIQR